MRRLFSSSSQPLWHTMGLRNLHITVMLESQTCKFWGFNTSRICQIIIQKWHYLEVDQFLSARDFEQVQSGHDWSEMSRGWLVLNKGGSMASLRMLGSPLAWGTQWDSWHLEAIFIERPRVCVESLSKDDRKLVVVVPHRTRQACAINLTMGSSQSCKHGEKPLKLKLKVHEKKKKKKKRRRV